MSDYPLHLQQMQEFRSLEIAIERQCKKINDRIQEMRDNLLITTARESGIERREKILKITPLDTDTLEERRYKVLLRWYDTYPYTQNDLIERLNRVCGEDEYALKIDKVNNKISCLVELTSKKMVKDVRVLLDGILSLNVVLDVGVRYNQYEKFKAYTHRQMGTYTHNQLRNEVLNE